ncbi:hypothetical protein EK21DRAFT_95195 [Setomelanomma holmii]|uniref:Uncharacterized protein n=1 Tax=Setomelanomma holmii TaxID=210430 RepID=A0A9P4GX72_9PLEO|nr:hypothetical protein EK21DRAFT_95195 [Setomelanomma holmii]
MRWHDRVGHRPPPPRALLRPIVLSIETNSPDRLDRDAVVGSIAAAIVAVAVAGNVIIDLVVALGDFGNARLETRLQSKALCLDGSILKGSWTDSSIEISTRLHRRWVDTLDKFQPNVPFRHLQRLFHPVRLDGGSRDEHQETPFEPGTSDAIA